MTHLRRWFARPETWILIGTILLSLFVILLAEALLPILIAFLIAYVLDPIVDYLESKKLGRIPAILVLLAGLLLALAILVLLIVPAMVDQVSSFQRRLPNMIDKTQHWLLPKLEEWTGKDFADVQLLFREKLTLLAGAVGGEELTKVYKQAVSTMMNTVGVFGLMFQAVLVGIFSIFFLIDFDRIKAWVIFRIPKRYQSFARGLYHEIDDKMSHFIRGQLLVCTILAGLYSLGLAISGVPMALPIGIIAGISSFMPFVGWISAIVLSLLVLLLNWQGWGALLGMGITIGVVNFLEGWVVVPLVLGNQVGLSSVWVLIALLLFGHIMGFAGILLAVPMASILAILWKRFEQHYFESRFYNEI